MPKPTAVTLKLNGKPFSLQRRPPTLDRLKALFDSWPDGEIFTTDETAKRAGCHRQSIQRCSLYEEMEPYSERWQSHRIFGNRRSIAELRRRMAEGQ